jgi:nickel/cobalt transporter (NicO) family protein
MPSFQDLIAQSAANAWLFIPMAIFLGALHGLEPGHSKTMMAAFIVAIRGTVPQAVLLGLSAAISHSLVIWLLAAGALYLGSQWDAQTSEPYFQMASGAIIIVLALWMLIRTRRDALAAAKHSHDPSGPRGGKLLSTGHGYIEVEVFETGVPPRFRLHFLNMDLQAVAPSKDETVKLEILRPDGEKECFAFALAENYLEATEPLNEPHEFKGALKIYHGTHGHLYPFKFHEHEHSHAALAVSDGDYQDAHEQAHAADIAQRFTDRNVTTPQIILFGLTGGLLPCPAALTVLLVCLQLKEFTLGFAMVFSFSLGLALTLVAAGAVAAWSVHHASKRIKGFGKWMRRVPYMSGAVLICLGLYVGIQGWRHLSH